MAFTEFPVYAPTSLDVNKQGVAQVREKMKWETNPAVRQFDDFYRNNQARFAEISKVLGWEVKSSLRDYSIEERIKIAETIKLLKPFFAAFHIPVNLENFKNV